MQYNTTMLLVTIGVAGSLLGVSRPVAADPPAIAGSKQALPERIFQAAANVVSRVTQRDMQWTQRTSGVWHARHTLSMDGPSASVKVDQATGIVVSLLSRERREHLQGEPIISLQNAQSLAAAFLDRVGVPSMQTWSMTRRQYLPGLRQYSFHWAKFCAGVKLPAFIYAFIDGDTGRITMYGLVDDPVLVSLQPRLTEADAVQLVAQRVGYAHPIVSEAQLEVWYVPHYPSPAEPPFQPQQALLWTIKLINPDARVEKDSTSTTQISAMNGDVNWVAMSSSVRPVPPGAKPKDLQDGIEHPPYHTAKLDLKALQNAKVPPTVFQLAERKPAPR